MERIFACIDLKSFFASVEAVERGLDPMKDNLVVADEKNGKGAITLAITPAMKKKGVKNRCRLFEIPEGIEYIIAKPKMKLYMKYSAEIYGIYLSFFAPEDIHIYSIDECFIDLTEYIKLYDKSPREIMELVRKTVYKKTKIMSSTGIGTNIFLAKLALDITAKKSEDNVGYLDMQMFEKEIKNHRPITDIWGIGKGIAKKLEKFRVYDLEGIRKINEKVMYKTFGVNAEILIDHANGIEPCTIKDIKKYTPESRGISTAQILHKDYNFEDAWIITKEMIEQLVLEITDMELKTNNISLKIDYSKEIIKHTGGSKKLSEGLNTYTDIVKEFKEIYDRTTSREKPIRRVTIALNDLLKKDEEQISLFKNEEIEKKELKVQKIMLELKKEYGKNIVLRGISYTENASARNRNKKIGGHNAGE